MSCDIPQKMANGICRPIGREITIAGIPQMIQRTQPVNAAVLTTWEEMHAELGHVPLSRIRTSPPPGTATVEDVIRSQESEGKTCELVDQTLVEKAVGFSESILAAYFAQWLRNYLDANKLGIVTCPDGIVQLFPGEVRAPDVAFYSWSRLPNGRVPTHPCPSVVPDFAIEVLSQSNTKAEMARKRREYFQAGVKLVWMVDIRARSVAVYTSPTQVTVKTYGDVLDASAILPGLSLTIEELFAQFDRSE